MFYKRFFPALLVSLTVLLLSTYIGAADAVYEGAKISSVGFDAPQNLADSSYTSYSGASENASVTVSRNDHIQFLYVVFDLIPEEWSITDNLTGSSALCGANGFLHEYVDVSSIFGNDVKSVTLSFPAGTVIADIYAFSEGDIPDWVQVWQPPCNEADLLLFSSHSDDEQLFFAGILPLYAGERGYSVQVAYIVQHFEVYGQYNHTRPHEQLNGLWAVGVKNYPVMSDFPDLYSESLDGAVSTFASVGVTRDDFSEYMIECIRRFKPLVVVSHDINGEYGHGTHILCTDTLRKVLEISSDPTQYPSSAEHWGTWTPEKTYLHLYSENQLVLDLDVPLESFGGKTAFEMTQHGFSYHKSQHWTWFYKWIYGSDSAPITKATQINGYSPCYYGLYQTSVGYDVVGGDMFENIKTYAVRHAEEEANTPPETEPIPPETDPDTSETDPVESDTSDTSQSVTEPDEPDTLTKDPDDSKKDPDDKAKPSEDKTLLIAAVVLFCVAVAAVIVIQGISVNRARKKHKRRTNR
ncbi:MAG: hypothetical protein E7672_05190 [Ruminococcaceae bacterium]|nr:hypothetical protein [Oscillospiraceae bacterium]